MSIRFHCTNCKKTLQAPDSTSGKNAKCNSCGTIVRIPAPTTATQAGSASSGSTQTQTAPTNQQSKPTVATIKCSSCTRTLRPPAGSEGKKLKCPCGAVLTMPSAGGNAPVVAPAIFNQQEAVAASQPTPFSNSSSDSSWLDVLPSAPTSPAAYSAHNTAPPSSYAAPPSSYAPPYSSPASPYDSTNSGSSSQSSMANMYLAHAAQSDRENAYVERGQSWSVDWPKVGGGVLAMVGACVWFFGAWIFARRIFIYPPILFIGGLIAVVNGLFSGD